MKVYQEIASLIETIRRCESPNASQAHKEWAPRHRANAEAIAKEMLPSGSGVDCGTKLLIDESTPDKLVFSFSYHHMNDAGMYCGWTDHLAIVRPSLASGFNLTITGRNRRGIKEYLHEIYQTDLDAELTRERRDEIALETNGSLDAVSLHSAQGFSTKS